MPVPPRADPGSTLSFWQWTLGYSYLFDFVLRRLDLLHDWYGDHKRVHAPGTGEHLACLLTGRLAELQKQSGAKVIVLAEYDPVVWDDPAFAAEQRRMTRGLLGCAAKAGLDDDRQLRHPGRDRRAAEALRDLAHERTRQSPDRRAGGEALAAGEQLMEAN